VQGPSTPSKAASPGNIYLCHGLQKGLYQVPGVKTMNPRLIIWAVILFQVFLIFCLWVSFSPHIISFGEILTRAGIVAAVAAAILTAIGVDHHRHVH
jgi:hypothetical protein